MLIFFKVIIKLKEAIAFVFKPFIRKRFVSEVKEEIDRFFIAYRADRKILVSVAGKL